VPSAADRGHAHGRDLRVIVPRRLSSDERGDLGARQGEITPGEAETIAGIVDTFVRAIEATKKEGSSLNLLQIFTAPSCVMKIIPRRNIMKNWRLRLRFVASGEEGPAAPMRPRAAARLGGFNQYGSSCCRVAAGAAIGKNRFNSWLQAWGTGCAALESRRARMLRRGALSSGGAWR